jgi:phosphoglycolate phosphatase
MDAIIFDLDGTLVDSRPDIVSSILWALGSRWRRSRIGVVAIGALVGQPLRAMFAAADPTADDAELEALCAAYREHYFTHCAVASRVYPGIREALDVLRPRVRIGCATTKRPDQAERVLHAFGLAAVLHAWRGTPPTMPYKPAPDLLHAIAADLGVPPDRMTYVGDTAMDLQAARAAGARAAWVRWGYGEATGCLAEAPDHVLEHPADLVGLRVTP